MGNHKQRNTINKYLHTMTKITLEKLRELCNSRARKPSSHEEHELQVACVNWFRLAYPEYRHNLFAVPNGGRRDAATGARLKAEGVLAGVADLILMRRAQEYGALLIELKTRTGRQQSTQKEWQQLIERDGYKYVICRSLDEFRNEIKKYLQWLK